MKIFTLTDEQISFLFEILDSFELDLQFMSRNGDEDDMEKGFSDKAMYHELRKSIEKQSKTF